MQSKNRFSAIPSRSVLQYLCHRILFDMQEATWGENIYFLSLTYHCALSFNAFFFPDAALCPHRQGPTNSRALGHSVACKEDVQGSDIHFWSACDISAPFCKDSAPSCCRSVDLQCASTWVVVIVNDPMCSGSDLK